MKPDRFKQLLDELDSNSLQTLKEKNAKYAKNGDCLHNFRSGAEVAGGTPAQACWGYMTKHLVALRDMVERDDFSNREDFLEKCQDTINYIRFLWCIGNEEMKKYTSAGVEPEKTEPKDTCRYMFATLDDVKKFKMKMEAVLNVHHEITKYAVYEYLDLPNDFEYYHVGWRSIDDWEIHEECDFMTGMHNVYVIMPSPVNL